MHLCFSKEDKKSTSISFGCIPTFNGLVVWALTGISLCLFAHVLLLLQAIDKTESCADGK